ncbi:DSC E3 ubiquitin ligase complex subunit 2 [Golovinomyces cichoracearum]|uniref:DSC E3 ubiquitin ligase complex subunit 2 n=1 Tax=Golovinomyces cichoracearum TaxID=62708 RepID=A0A420HBX5_9PEZI|nr:DSC E3 ubiquitin ligase complex subunit 2 [Golovinomyces cichoracearum]
MLTTGFTNAPVSRSLVYGIVVVSLLISITDNKHFFYIQVNPHLWPYRQIWRLLIYQLCYMNSTETLFAAICLYNMRVIERLWGSRKYASFLILCFAFLTFLPPMLLALILRPLSFYNLNYLPAGPTPLIFAVLAQYHAVIPHVFKYRIATSASPPSNDAFVGLTFSDKSYLYLLAIQLALSQIPGSLISAGVGWAVGYLWRNDVLPGSLTRWRIPGWMVGARPTKRSDEFEVLRRRLEVENTNSDPAFTTGSDENQGTGLGRRRTLGRQLMDQFRGAF